MKKAFLIFAQILIAAFTFTYAQSSDRDYGYAENNPLYFGNPSDALADQTEEWNYLLEKPQYTLSYNNYTLGPNWVAWHLSSGDLGQADRSNKFTADKELPENWYRVKKSDYQYNAYGFDRGHVCPSADRTLTKDDNEQTFLMTNMLPQAPDCNRIVWKDLETYERQLALQGNELYIFAGGAGRGGVGDKGYFEEILIGDSRDRDNGDRDNWHTVDTGGMDTDTGDGDSRDRPLSITVPEFCWKIILVLPEGEGDLERVTPQTQVICVCVPNKQGCNDTGSWEQYECSVNYIEEITHLDFFELLDDELEELLES